MFVLYNTNFIQSVYQIRQIILHGGVTVNGLICNSPSKFLFPGDIVKIIPKFQYLVYKKIYTSNSIKKPLCSFLEVNYNTLSCFILSVNQENKSTVPYDTENNLSLLNFISLR